MRNRQLTEASKFDSMVLRIEAVALAMSNVSSLRWFTSKIEVRDSSPSLGCIAFEDFPSSWEDHGTCLNMVVRWIDN